MGKNIFILIINSCLMLSCSRTEKSGIAKPLDEISLSDVDISDDFWSPRIENNHRVSFPYMLDRYERNGGRPNPKLMEAGAYILNKNPDPELQNRLDANFDKLIEYYIPDGQVRE